MDFNDYQKQSRKTWGVNSVDPALAYDTLGLVNEAGELAGKVKKLFRDNDNVVTPEFREAVKGELGDVLWYMTQIATDLAIPMEDVAEHNIEKIMRRLANNTIHGSGDNR